MTGPCRCARTTDGIYSPDKRTTPNGYAALMRGMTALLTSWNSVFPVMERLGGAEPMSLNNLSP
jgi:hypothetical protein